MKKEFYIGLSFVACLIGLIIFSRTYGDNTPKKSEMETLLQDLQSLQVEADKAEADAQQLRSQQALPEPYRRNEAGVAASLKDTQERLKPCLDIWSKLNPSRIDELPKEVTILKSGRLKVPTVPTGSTGDTGLAECFAAGYGAQLFESGPEMTMSYPLQSQP